MAKASIYGVLPQAIVTFTLPSSSLDPNAPDVTVTLEFRYRESRSPQLVELLGVDEQTVVMECHAVNPRRIPTSIQPGAKAPLERHGRMGLLTVERVTTGKLPAVMDAVGQEWLASWRANG